MTQSPTRRTRAAGIALTALMASASVMTLAASPALAVPAGGYGDLVAQVSPSVVYIEVTEKAKEVDMTPNLPQGMPEQMRRQFEQMFPHGGEVPERQGVGSGFIISRDGTIVTNNHVVDGADSVVVKLQDGRSFDAKVIGADPMTDIAVIKVDTGEDLPAVTFGDSGKMRAGDEVVAVGNPFGLSSTVTSGIISATSRDIHSGPYDDFIQTDAAINRGNSGGPLFNNAGEVIGVNTAIFSPDGGSVGIGFAVPSDLVKTVVADLEDDGTITRGWLGVQIKPMSQEIASVLGYDSPKGAVVSSVMDDSPAKKAGLKDGDIILSFGGKQINDLRDLTRAVASTAPDKQADVVLLRKGEKLTETVTVGTMAKSKA